MNVSLAGKRTATVASVKMLWVHRDIDAKAEVVWELLTTPSQWHKWGPTLRSATLDGDTLEFGATGTVTTVVGVSLPFEITGFEEGKRWGWKVAGVPATDHTVEPIEPDRCRVGFGVPWAAAPYLAVCRYALARLEKIATHHNAMD